MNELKNQNSDKEKNNTENKIPIEGEEISKTENNTQKENQQFEEIGLNSFLEKIAELEKENAVLKDTLLRKIAEFENYKRRNENDQLNLLKYAAEPFIKNVLSVYDDLERSLSHIDERNNYDSMKKGVQLVFEKFSKILESQGVKKIEAKGEPFDVHFHEALMQQPVEGVAPHIILEVIEPGYIYKDKVIRHAKVVVSAELASSASGNEEINLNQEG